VIHAARIAGDILAPDGLSVRQNADQHSMEGHSHRLIDCVEVQGAFRPMRASMALG
jgi:hypothetical protein